MQHIQAVGSTSPAGKVRMRGSPFADGLTAKRLLCRAFLLLSVAASLSAQSNLGAALPPWGTSGHFIFTWSEASRLSYVQAAVGSYDWDHNCFLTAGPTGGYWLYEDAGIMPAPFASNSRCRIDGLTASIDENDKLTIEIDLTFTELYEGEHEVYMCYRAIGSDSPRWAEFGDWKVMKPPPPRQIPPLASGNTLSFAAGDGAPAGACQLGADFFYIDQRAGELYFCRFTAWRAVLLR